MCFSDIGYNSFSFNGMLFVSVLALSVTFGDSSPKGRAKRVPSYSKASPSGRGGERMRDGEGKPP